jgi:hypothetical protein
MEERGATLSFSKFEFELNDCKAGRAKAMPLSM